MSKTLAKAPEILPRIPIDNLVHQIKHEWAEGARLARRLHDKRLQVGCWLLELQQRIEAGEEGEYAGGWWQWYADNFPDRSERDARKLMEDAAASDPASAIEARRAYDAEQSRAYRGR
jgi:hypothetical protein